MTQINTSTIIEDCNSAELSVLFSEWANATGVEISDSGEISYTLSRGGYGWQTATDEQLAAFVE